MLDFILISETVFFPLLDENDEPAWSYLLTVVVVVSLGFQNQSMLGQQMRQMTPNQPYTSMQPSQARLLHLISLFCLNS